MKLNLRVLKPKIKYLKINVGNETLILKIIPVIYPNRAQNLRTTVFEVHPNRISIRLNP